MLNMRSGIKKWTDAAESSRTLSVAWCVDQALRRRRLHFSVHPVGHGFQVLDGSGFRMRLGGCEQDRRLLAIPPDKNIDRIGVAAVAGMFAEDLSAELGQRHVLAPAVAVHHADLGVARRRDHGDDHGIGGAIEDHAAPRAGALDRQRARIEKSLGIVGREPFAAAEFLARRADIADCAPRHLGQRLQECAVGGPAGSVDAQRQDVFPGQRHDRRFRTQRIGRGRPPPASCRRSRTPG